MKYRAEIDGLRAFAIVAVILFHSGFDLFSGGFVGVDVFFVISGYLITTILIDDIENNQFKILNFYERRARRILPALYVVVITTLIMAYFVLLPENMLSLGKSAISIPFFSSNFFFWFETGYFGDTTELKPLAHTWSLSVEEQFYIVFPVFLLAVYKFGNKAVLSSLLIIFFLSITSCYYLTFRHFDTAFYFPFTRAWELILGALCTIIIRKNWYQFSTIFSEVISLIGILLILFACITFNSSTMFPYINALIPTLGTALFLVSSNKSKLVRKFFSLRILVLTGLISYSMYLWHQPLFALARHLDIFEKSEVILIFLTIILSILSYFLIEKPFRNKKKISTKVLLKVILFFTIIILLIGMLIVFKNGLPSRYALKDQALLTQFVKKHDYNQKRFNDMRNKDFISSSKTKVVLVGDSHAADFLNILYESGLFKDYEFSTHTITTECGNIMLLNYDDIVQFIPKSRIEHCKRLGWYEDKDIKHILFSADEIWVVSLWKDWVIDFIPQSLVNLHKKYSKPVRLFGQKNFGTINAKIAVSIKHQDRNSYQQLVNKSNSDIAIKLDKKMKQYEFYYPIMDDLCKGNREQCKIFTEDGLLISSDGQHLTKEGAIEGAIRLNKTLRQLKNNR